MNKILAAVLAGALAVGPLQSALAQQRTGLAVPDYGKPVPHADVANKLDPSLHYRVAFEVARKASDPGKVNPALIRVARFMNLLEAAGIRPGAADVIVIVHDAATTALLSDAAYRERFKRPNPNAKLIAELQAAGVAIHVCNYALVGQKVERATLLPKITVDLAAMVTLATLQLQGWAVIIG